jgi:DNA-binding Xre family transcriptional regulator
MQGGILPVMTEVPNDAYDALNDALVVEIKALMARRGVSSSRALGDLIGMSSQAVSMRLDGGNSKTGKRVQLSTTDLARIAEALSVAPDELLHMGIAALQRQPIADEQPSHSDDA